MKDRIKHEATIDLIIHPEDLPIRGNLVASGDDVLDKQLEDAVIEESEHTPWAWCFVELKATWKGLSHSEYLGCCSYRSEGDFRVDGYFNDMVAEAIEQLHQKAKNIIDDWS
jgi:hypothetical protein